ncbi:3'-5' exonuclease [Bacillus sp. M6-12]|uniref:3'-5' exonuclease n=1 Tax=Bacillus sp. M6-12 TaxID=2054166 RepID=UPI000C7662AC|nr:3'-5' exonuclease [Bacillus sp. M6-12]PLS19614.1 3'-5' exonuclease [Bacillus sp. M6-12]
MKNYIVFDLEATCIDKIKYPEQAKTFPNEVVEIGAVKINEKGEIVDSFERFVKPILNPVLTDYCKNLTKIPQSKIDEAEGFPDVIQAFKEWIGEDYILCSWGHYDKKQFKKDCELHKLSYQWVLPHISLKHQHQAIRKLKHGMGTRKALHKEGFAFEGTPHRGIDDAKNIAKIFVKYLNQWDFRKEE